MCPGSQSAIKLAAEVSRTSEFANLSHSRAHTHTRRHVPVISYRYETDLMRNFIFNEAITQNVGSGTVLVNTRAAPLSVLN